MTMFAYPIDLLTIAGFGILGFWLEPINGKQGFIDDLLAPAPLRRQDVFSPLLKRSYNENGGLTGVAFQWEAQEFASAMKGRSRWNG
jgi:hypothetical protein